MRNNYLIHGFWIIIAIGAFATGRMQQSSSGDGDGDSLTSSKNASRSLRQPGASRQGGPGRDAEGRTGNEAREAPGGSTLSSDAMQAALTSVLAETDPIARQRRFAELLASLTPENAQAAVQALRDAPRSRGWGQEYSLLTYAWGRLDGPAAVAYAKELEGRNKEWTMASVLAGWANHDPEGAKQWVSAIQDEGERSTFTRGLVYGLAQKDVDAATSFVFSLDPDTPRRNDYIGTIARQQLSQGIDAAATWSESLPDGALKGRALESVAREFVRSDPSQAAAWVSKYAESDYGTSAIAEISEEWAEDDPKAALDWVTTLPEGANRSRALSETISEWARENATDAGEFLADLPAGSERDAAVGSYVNRVANQEPEAAIEWAQSIGQEELRNETIARTARRWFSNDVAAASAWLEAAQLPEAVAQEILRPNENNRGSDRRRR